MEKQNKVIGLHHYRNSLIISRLYRYAAMTVPLQRSGNASPYVAPRPLRRSGDASTPQRERRKNRTIQRVVIKSN